MSYHGHHKLVGTADTDGEVALDSLVIPFPTSSTIGTITGSLRSWVQSVSISGTAVTIQFKPDFGFRAGSAFVPRATTEGGSVLWHAAVASYNATTKALVLNTYNAAGTLTAPPAGTSVQLLAAIRW